MVQDGTYDTERFGYQGGFGAFYDINAYNSINSNISFRGFQLTRDGGGNSYFSDPFNMFNMEMKRESDAENLNSGFDWNTDNRRTFPKSEKEFSLGFQASSNVEDSENLISQTGNYDFLLRDEKSQNDGNNLEYTLQLDYILPLSKKAKLETGIKGIARAINSDFTYDTLNRVRNVYVLDRRRSDEFNYGQNVYSGYVSIHWKINDLYSLISGLRYERTGISGEYLFDDTEFSNDYDNFLPSVILSRQEVHR